MSVDEQMIATARDKLYAAVLSDVLDELGYRHQVLPPQIRPLDEAWCWSAARAPGSIATSITCRAATTPTSSRSR